MDGRRYFGCVFPFFEKKRNQSNMGVARVGKLTNRLLLVDYRLTIHGQKEFLLSNLSRKSKKIKTERS